MGEQVEEAAPGRSGAEEGCEDAGAVGAPPDEEGAVTEESVEASGGAVADAGGVVPYAEGAAAGTE